MKEEGIAGIPLFASLSRDEIRHLAATLHERELPEQEILFEEGEVNDQVFILLEGEVEIIKVFGKTGERLLGVRGAGTIFGEMSLFNPEGRRTATVRSRTPLRMLEIPRAEFEVLLSRHPALTLELLRIQSARLEASENATIMDLLEKKSAAGPRLPGAAGCSGADHREGDPGAGARAGPPDAAQPPTATAAASARAAIWGADGTRPRRGRRFL